MDWIIFISELLVHLDQLIITAEETKDIGAYCFFRIHCNSYAMLSMFLIFIWQCTFELLLYSFAALLLCFGIVAYCGIVCRHYWIVVLLTLNNLLCAYNKQLMPIKSWIIDVQFVSTSIQNILEVLSFSSVLSDVIFNCNLAILFHFQQ